MKLRCKKFLSPLGDGKEIKESSFLTIGREYIALGLDFNKKKRSVYMLCDDEEDFPGYFDIRQFEIVSNYIPSNWIINYDEKFDSLEFFPKAWLEIPDFWDRFIDDQDSDIVALFKREKEIIYREEPK